MTPADNFIAGERRGNNNRGAVGKTKGGGRTNKRTGSGIDGREEGGVLIRRNDKRALWEESKGKTNIVLPKCFLNIERKKNTC